MSGLLAGVVTRDGLEERARDAVSACVGQESELLPQLRAAVHGLHELAQPDRLSAHADVVVERQPDVIWHAHVARHRLAHESGRYSSASTCGNCGVRHGANRSISGAKRSANTTLWSTVALAPRNTKPGLLLRAKTGFRDNRDSGETAVTTSIALVPQDRAEDLADLGPIACTYCPEKYPHRATWTIEWTTVGCAIGGPERREHCCDLDLAEAMRFAAEMNLGMVPPIVSPLDSTSVVAA